MSLVETGRGHFPYKEGLEKLRHLPGDFFTKFPAIFGNRALRNALILGALTFLASNGSEARAKPAEQAFSNEPPAASALSFETNVEKTKAAIEAKRGVVIHEAVDLEVEPAFKMLGIVYNGFKAANWDPQELKLLDGILGKLPESFYSPVGGEKTHIILSSHAYCGEGKTQPRVFPRQISIAEKHFKADAPLHSGMFLAHEFIHQVTLTEETGDSCVSLESPNNAYFARVDEIFGVPFAEIRKPFLDRVLAKEEELGDPNAKAQYLIFDEIGDEKVYEQFGWARLNYSFSREVPTELLAVAGENYYLGREHFYEVYEEIFTQEQSDKLYALMNEIYEGKEYSPLGLDRLNTFWK